MASHTPVRRPVLNPKPTIQPPQKKARVVKETQPGPKKRGHLLMSASAHKPVPIVRPSATTKTESGSASRPVQLDDPVYIKTCPPSSALSHDPLDDIFISTLHELSCQQPHLFGSINSVCSLVGIPPAYMTDCIQSNPKIIRTGDYITSPCGMFARAPVMKLMIIRICLGGDITTPLCRRLLRYFLIMEKSAIHSPLSSPKRKRPSDQVFYTAEQVMNLSRATPVFTINAKPDFFHYPAIEFIDKPEWYGALSGVSSGDTRVIVGTYNHVRGKDTRFIVRFIDDRALIKHYYKGTLCSSLTLTDAGIQQIVRRGLDMFRAMKYGDETQAFVEGKVDIAKNNSGSRKHTQ